MNTRIYLVGNPNAGKTLLFNVLTGHNAKVANFPGVTVEKREGSLAKNRAIQLVDLPGLYSLTPRSEEEKLTTQVVKKALNDAAQQGAVVAVADATQLGKGLFLVSQLKDCGVLRALVLTMADLLPQTAHAQQDALSKRLGVPVFLVSAAQKQGLSALNAFLAKLPQEAPLREAQKFNASVEDHHQRVATWLEGLHFGESASKRITRKLDSIALHPFLGPLILIALFSLLFEGLFVGSKPFVAVIEEVKNWASLSVHSFLSPDSLLGSLLADGIIGGVGSVLAFVPLIAFLFLFLGALEDSGYMARAVCLLHRVMSKVGLSGRAFVPLVSGFSCSIPAILSTRIIESRPDRLTTILVTPLISCSARLPIYGLLIAAAFSQTPALWGFVDVGALVMIGLYVMGLLLAFIVAAILRRGFIKGERAPLIMELPDYRWPRPRSLWLAVRSRVRIFVKEAGTVILALTVVLWALFTFPLPDKTAMAPAANEVVEEMPFAHISSSQLERSYAGQLGHLIEPVIAPLGFNWKIGVGLVASFAAREVFISTFGVIYGLSEAGEAPSSLWKAMQADVHPKTGLPVYTPLVALSLLIFFAVALQCLSTVAATRKETGSWRWPLFQIGYLNGLAWCLSFCVFQIGTKLGF